MKEVKEKILAESIRIGDELLASVISHSNGYSWLSASPLQEGFVWKEQNDLYSGTSGIALFLLELYRITNNTPYFKVAEEALHRVEATMHESVDDLNFLTGRMSLPFILLRFYSVTSDREYLKKAVSVAKIICKDIPKNGSYEFLNGLSGTVLALLHIHSYSKDQQILNIINIAVEHIISGIKFGIEGVFWDPSGNSIRGLCGLSHGASGVGFVFLELGYYFKNSAFYWVAEQAFKYEEFYFDKEKLDWPDFRLGAFTDKEKSAFEDAYRTGNLNFFTNSKSMNAWCHGAPGIGLSRLRAYELLNLNCYKQQAETALVKTQENYKKIKKFNVSPNLCHGSGGNAEILIEAYRIFNDTVYLDRALEVAQKILQNHAQFGFYRSGSLSGEIEDTSLFLGNAGVGYFFLRILDPLGTPSILAPAIIHLPNNEDLLNYSALSLSIGALQEALIRKVFPRLFSLMEQCTPEIILEFFEYQTHNEVTNLMEVWISYLNLRLEEAADSSFKMPLLEIFNLELIRLRMTQSVISNALLKQKRKEKLQDIAQIFQADDSDLQSIELVLDTDMVLNQTFWDWGEFGNCTLPNLKYSSDKHNYLLIPTYLGDVKEVPLNTFSYNVLSLFKTRNNVHNVVVEMLNKFEAVTSEDAETLRTGTYNQISQAVKSGFLIKNGRHKLACLQYSKMKYK